MAFHLAGGRVQRQGIEGAFVIGALEQVEERGRLPTGRRQAQVVAHKAGACGLLEAGPDGVVVHHQRRCVLVELLRAVAATAFATLVLLPGGGGVGQQFVQAFAVPLVGPEQARQGEQQIEQQAPGSGDGVQVPVEGAAFFGPLQCQPGSPVQRLAWPAQVQAREAEEHQHQGAGAGDLPAGVAHGQKAVQLQHQVEEALPGDFALELAGVGIGIAHFAATLARWRLEEDPRGVAIAGVDPQHRDGIALGGFDSAHQLGRWQHAFLAHLDLEYVRVEQAQQFFLEGVDRPGDPHQCQHQAGGDAKEPVQLEQRLLHHIVHLVWAPGEARRALCLGTRKPRSPER